MRKKEAVNEAEEPLVDTTVAIPLKSKRTQRKQKRLRKKEKADKERTTLLDLPSELFMNVLIHLRPRDVLTLSQVSKDLKDFILSQQAPIAREIINLRYRALTKCFPLPTLLENVDPTVHLAMLSQERQAAVSIHKKPYQHIKPPEAHIICTCLVSSSVYLHMYYEFPLRFFAISCGEVNQRSHQILAKFNWTYPNVSNRCLDANFL
jgi:hypothetical protein